MNLGCLVASIFVLQLLQLPLVLDALPSVVKIGEFASRQLFTLQNSFILKYSSHDDLTRRLNKIIKIRFPLKLMFFYGIYF